MKPEPQPAQDTGRRGYREPGDPEDGRRVIVRGEFWESPTERFTYEVAAECNPQREDEGRLAHAARISAIATGKLQGEAVKQFPQKQSRRDRDEQLHKLRGQVEPGEEYWNR